MAAPPQLRDVNVKVETQENKKPHCLVDMTVSSYLMILRMIKILLLIQAIMKMMIIFCILYLN